MSITGQSVKSIRKKDLQRSNKLVTGFKKLVFAHKAVAGETGIDTSSLTTPTEMNIAGFVQPNGSELASAKLNFYRKNFKLISSSKGELLDYVSYQVPTNSHIDFVDFTADEGEVFIGVLDYEPVTGISVVDADALVVTGVLSAGAQDIASGPFEYFKFSAQQVGAVKVYIDGVQQFRNVGNVTADPGADGNYQEVQDGSSETASIIRLNDIDAINDRNYLIVSTGLLYNKPDGSRDAALEVLQTTVDSMVPVLADAAGVAETVFQAAPSQADLAAFAHRVFKIENFRGIASDDVLADRTSVGPVDRIRFDTLTGVGTLVLPASPNFGDWIEVLDSKGNFNTSNLTIDRNSHLIEGAAADYVENRDDARIKLVYDGPSRGWLIMDMT